MKLKREQPNAQARPVLRPRHRIEDEGENEEMTPFASDRSSTRSNALAWLAFTLGALALACGDSGGGSGGADCPDGAERMTLEAEMTQSSPDPDAPWEVGDRVIVTICWDADGEQTAVEPGGNVFGTALHYIELDFPDSGESFESEDAGRVNLSFSVLGQRGINFQSFSAGISANLFEVPAGGSNADIIPSGDRLPTADEIDLNEGDSTFLHSVTLLEFAGFTFITTDFERTD